MRGGVSLVGGSYGGQGTSSPRAWGCFPPWRSRSRRKRVFPTCVGVFHTVKDNIRLSKSLPHVRGGVSDSCISLLLRKSSSPRAWGCFLSVKSTGPGTSVFPTCVGVFLVAYKNATDRPCLPHVRGGVSNGTNTWLTVEESSPRAWGCF